MKAAREMSPDELESDSDAAGTGERGTAVGSDDADEGADIAPDRIESEAEMAASKIEPEDLAPEEDVLPEAGPIDADFKDLAEESEAADEEEDEDAPPSPAAQSPPAGRVHRRPAPRGRTRKPR